MARTSRAVWEKRVERWQESGLSAKEFATEIGVRAQSLMIWKWKLRQTAVVTAKSENAPIDAPKFLQLVAAPKTSITPSPMDIILPGGVTLRVQHGFHEPTLMRLISLLGAR